jgi:hypothetical protein
MKGLNMHKRHSLVVALSACMAAMPFDIASAAAVWHDAPAPQASPSARASAGDPAHFRRVTLDRNALSHTMRSSRSASAGALELPLPDGGSSRFELDDADVLPASLAARYPGLKSLKGRDAAGRRARVDVSPAGVHAAISDPDGDWIVQPETASTSRAGSTPHIVFRRVDARASQHREEAGMIDATTIIASDNAARTSSAGVVRTFRIAMTATPSYTAHMGGSVEDALAGIVRTVNRVNDIFENDLGLHLVLANESDKLVFTQTGENPFADVAGKDTAIALRNVEVAERVLGKDAFDVGHVLDGQRDAGWAGAIGNTCQPWDGKAENRGASKAAGITGSQRPFGDAFHVDYVAHELGHQFGARHTFNGCHASNRDEQGSYAPGSGSTLMGYAGICESAHNLQTKSDAYFHAASIDQIQAWIGSVGGSCAKARINTSPAPWLDTTGWHRPLVVPAGTPFRLSGKAAFADPAARLTYTFEQMDLGDIQPRGAGVTDVGSGPLFRSRPPHPDGEQTFPAMAVLLGDEPLGRGDAMPASGRELHFRMTARDNIDHRSHVVSAERSVKVVDTGAAFEVIAPRAGAVLRKGKPRQVRWNVAGTARAPVSCRAIRIDLSLDGGRTFVDTPLAASVPNKGRASITIPEGISASRHGRLRASCADGGFFALSPGEIEIR